MWATAMNAESVSGSLKAPSQMDAFQQARRSEQVRQTTLILGSICLSLNSLLYASEVASTIQPAPGQYGGIEGRTVTDINATDDGHLIEFLIAPGSTGFVPTDIPIELVTVTWNSESWTKLTIDQTEVVSDESVELALDGVFFVDFNPHKSIPGISLPKPTESMTLEPRSYEFSLVPNLELVCEGAECQNDILVTLEYSIESVDDPLPGDFNFDGITDFNDFIILTRHFGVNDPIASQALPSFAKGDANLDGQTDFADFNILVANFGATQATSEASSVPEPGTKFLILCGVVTLLSFRRAKGRSSRQSRRDDG